MLYTYNFRAKKELINLEEIASKFYYGCSKCPMASPNFNVFQSHLEKAHPNSRDKNMCRVCGMTFGNPVIMYKLKNREITGEFELIQISSDRLLFVNNCIKDSYPDEISFVHHKVEKSVDKNQVIIQHLSIIVDNNDVTNDKFQAGGMKRNFFELDEDTMHYPIETNFNKQEAAFQNEKNKVWNENFEENINFNGNFSNVRQKRNFSFFANGKAVSPKSFLNPETNDVYNKSGDFQCAICKKKFRCKSTLLNHVETVHHKIKDFLCDICNQYFDTKDNLKTHINTLHIGLKNLPCKICGKLYSKAYLGKHMKRMHENSDKHKKLKTLFQCNLCDKEFVHKANLETHVDIDHFGIKKFSCTICDKKFKRKQNLNMHLKMIHYFNV